MTSKRFIALTISLLCILPLYKFVQACADEGDYEGASTFFANDITAKPAYRPFYYTEGPKYYDESWYNEPAPLPDPNVAEWKSYTAGAVPEADLDSLIYGSTYNDLKSLYGFIEKGTPLAMDAKYSSNAFVNWFRQQKDFEALGYLMYAKQCEPYVTSAGDWEAPETDTARMNRLMKNGQQLYAAAKHPLMKDKYAFQVIRLAFYANRPAQAMALFDQLAGARADSSYTYLRCQELRAGALFRLKRKVEAAYQYSRIFDQSDYLKKSSFISFDWCVGQDATPVLKLCQSAHERAVVHLMDGLHKYEAGLPALQAAYEADARLKGLDVLMTREINKLEQRYQRPVLFAERRVGSYPPSVDELKEAQQYSGYLAQLNSFAQKAFSEKKAASPAFWALSSSYLYFMQRNTADCKRMMDAAKAAGMAQKEQDMYHTLQVLYAVRNSGTMTPQLEAQILPDLKWLTGQHERQPFMYAMNTIITTAYLKAGDTTKAIYTLGKGNLYNAEDFTDDAGNILESMSIERLHQVEAFADKKDKTPYERWLMDSTIYTAERLYELEGTKYLRRQEFARAIAPLEKSARNPDLQDPFNITISENMKWPEDDSSTLMSKLEFARRMAGLEAKLANAPDDPALLMEYATGLYNMSYYGNAYHAYTYYRGSSDERAYFLSKERTDAGPDAQEFYGVMKAEAAFARAALKAGGKEQQAKALFMAARCWQKRCPGGPHHFYEEQQDKAYYTNSLRNPYFLQLKTAAANTDFYKEAIGTCGYLKDYAKRK